MNIQMQMHFLSTLVFDIDTKPTNYKTSAFKGTIMQIEKALIAYVFQKYPANFAFQPFIILQ